ncbi:DinB family protein [Aquibacillus kalidii]|uniref:DinB family protein n=1 Tax=Aquibacillus kalidii TaxID=2762597 RepID=UPI0016489D7F|nr:DinB family protein [Aquibacillus kalidii]
MIQRHEVLFKQIETYRNEILSVIEDITDKDAERIPKGFNNNIRWNLGHILLDQYLWIITLTKDSLPISPDYKAWFGFGTSPSDFTEKTPSLSELKQLLIAQPNEIKMHYGNKLDVTFPPIEMGLYTIEQVLIRTIFHEGMHLQTIIDIRKLLN